MEMNWQGEGPGLIEEVTPQPGYPHTHTIVFLHGRGDTAPDFKECIQYNTWADSLKRSPMDIFPTFRWVFPTAGMKQCVRPGVPPSISQWFDIWDHTKPREKEEIQAPGLSESVERITKLIADEAIKLGGRYDKIVLMDISQGGATSAETLLNLALPECHQGPKRLGAFVGVACRMPFPGRSLEETRKVPKLNIVPNGDEVIRNTPILLEHNINDPTVLFESGMELRQILEGFGAPVVWKEYPDGGHWFKSPEGLDDVTVFLSKVLLKE